MSVITRSIGDRWEAVLKQMIPELISVGEDPIVPDFYHPPTETWIEAKAGNIGWGVRIKDYQTLEFDKFKRPVVYALGFHDFHEAGKRLVQRTRKGRERFLERNMEILQICFITQDMMKKLWAKERRVNGKGNIAYCMIKNSVLNNVFERREFNRFGKVVRPESYYGFSYGDYEFIVQGERRAIFQRRDSRFRDYLFERGIFK